MVALAAGAGAAVDVETGDDGCDRGQVGLVLGMDDGVDQGLSAVGAGVAGDVNDAVHLLGQWASGPWVSGGPSRLLGLGGVLLASKGCGLTLAGALEFVELLAQLAELALEVGDGLLQFGAAAVAGLAAGALRRWCLLTHAGGVATS